MKTLAEAARTGNVELIELLLADGDNPNAEETLTHWSPLIEAAFSNRAEVAHLLLDAGAHRYAPSKAGDTALYVAVTQKSFEVVQVLRDHGYRPKEGRDKAARLLYTNNVAVLEWLVSEGIDVDATEGSNASDWTALMWASYKGDVELAAALLRLGARPDLYNALHSPLAMPNDELLRVLVSAGADTSSALVDAVTRGQYAIVEQLLEYGPDVNAKDAQGHTCYYYAQRLNKNYAGKEAIVGLLARHGARLNRRDVADLAKRE